MDLPVTRPELEGAPRLRKPVEVGRTRRRRVADALDAMNVLDRLLWLRGRLSRDRLVPLVHHRICDPASPAVFDEGVVDATAEELAATIGVLKERCSIISLADLRPLGKRRLPPNPVLLTFDDGYAECHDVALPILKRAGVRATFFVPTAYPDAGRLFFWDRIALVMQRVTREAIVLTYPSPAVLFPKRDPVGATEAVTRLVKRTPGLVLDQLWEELERATGVVLSKAEEQRLAARTLLSWSKVRALVDAGMDVQSHSHEHLVLNTLRPEAVRRDLTLSHRILREQLDREVFAVAYPVGFELVGATRAAVAETPFEMGFTCNTGACRLGRGLDPLNVPRTAMDIGTTSSLLKTLLLLSPPKRPAFEALREVG